MRSKVIILGVVFLVGVVMSPLARAQSPPAPGPQERCAVCGMYVAHFQNWVAVLEFRDGTRFYFDGPKDLFTCFFDLSAYRKNATPAEVAAVYVTEYYGTELTDAREVFFVTGSDVLGPMGKELVPVRGRDAAETFRRDHHGNKLMIFSGSDLVEVPPQP